MQNALGNLFRSIAEVIDTGANGNDPVAAVAVAVEAAPVGETFVADAPLAADTGMSDTAVEDGIIDLIENSDFTHRKAVTLAEKLGVDVAKVKTVAENSGELFIYTKRSNGETMIRLS